jgi:hypothetical protein
VGKSGFWNTISLGLGGPHLTATQEQIFDELAVASLNPDPRIWPLKVARLLATCGSPIVGLAGALIALEDGYIGPPAMGAAAAAQVELQRFAEQGDLEQEIHRRLDNGVRIMGFGVPNRDEDERILAARGLVDAHDLSKGRFWRLMVAIEAVTLSSKSLRANIGAATAAIFLDMGFDPKQIGVLSTLMLLNNILANAYEGTERTEETLREVPRDLVHYAGPPHRLSPRARVRRASDDSQ